MNSDEQFGFLTSPLLRLGDNEENKINDLFTHAQIENDNATPAFNMSGPTPNFTNEKTNKPSNLFDGIISIVEEDNKEYAG